MSPVRRFNSPGIQGGVCACERKEVSTGKEKNPKEVESERAKRRQRENERRKQTTEKKTVTLERGRPVTEAEMQRIRVSSVKMLGNVSVSE